jgi:hypothetical protein
MALVVRVDPRVVPAPRHRHIRQAPIDEVFAGTLRVHVHEHAAGRLPLAAVACHGIALVEMGMTVDLERDGSARIEAQLQMDARVHLLDGPELAIRPQARQGISASRGHPGSKQKAPERRRPTPVLRRTLRLRSIEIDWIRRRARSDWLPVPLHPAI